MTEAAIIPEPLAHSARNGAPSQTYLQHVTNVGRFAAIFARDAAQYSTRWQRPFLAAVDRAATYHDLGKLDELFQDVLRHNCDNKHKFNHVEAGTAYLLQSKQYEAAIACYSHHIGLPSIPAEKAKDANGVNLALRDTGPLIGLAGSSCQRTDRSLHSYLAQHHRLVPAVAAVSNSQFSGLVRRLALSCLVDADHSDTAQHYQQEPDLGGPPLRAAERLAKLEQFVAELSSAETALSEPERLRLAIRREVFKSCRDRVLGSSERIVACDSPVGTGKTTAVMAHLLNVARDRGLRRVFVVLPYTNIIDQSVDVYRRSLVLDGEQADEAVAAHHHRVEFAGERWRDLRQLAQRWEAPIVVTTAVQFFETLAAKATGALRKLHQLPGSAIFVDEAHAAMPVPLWPQMWLWLRELCDDWGCHLVLASGSLSRFWDLADFVAADNRAAVAELVPEATRIKASDLEENRVSLMHKHKAMSICEISEFVRSKRGPRLVIFNTVQAAAVFAEHLRTQLALPAHSEQASPALSPHDRADPVATKRNQYVEHLSTALSPHDRERILKRVRARLRDHDDSDWTLVATSCVEAGVDFSFRTAFRESCGLVNLLQASGRVNRSCEYDAAEVWDFRHSGDDFLTLHPHFKTSRRVLEQLFREGAADMYHCTEALKRELNFGNGEAEHFAADIKSCEEAADYPGVAEMCRLITADTQTVLVDQEMIAKIEKGDRSDFPKANDLMRHSVEIWRSRLAYLAPKSLGPGDELFALYPEQYDDFLGYMRGLLSLLKIQNAGSLVT